MFPCVRTSILLGFLGVLHLGRSQEEVEISRVDANKWDLRNKTDNKGCGTEDEDGCSPDYTIDGLLNDVWGSRWSCHEDDVTPSGECIIDFYLEESYLLDHITLYFHKSNETDRDVNTFLLSVSDDEEDYEVAMEGENTIPTPLGSGNDFMFEDGVRGRVVRLTGTNADDTWLSISEAKIFISEATPSPSVMDTSMTESPMRSEAPTVVDPPTTESPAPSEAPIVVDPPTTESPAPSEAPDVVPTVVPTVLDSIMPVHEETLAPMVGTPAPVIGTESNSTQWPTVTPEPETVAPEPTPEPTIPGGSRGDVVTSQPVALDVAGEDGDDGNNVGVAVIAGSIAAGVALLVVLGVGVAYSRRKDSTPQQAPPTYNDIVGNA